MHLALVQHGNVLGLSDRINDIPAQIPEHYVLITNLPEDFKYSGEQCRVENNQLILSTVPKPEVSKELKLAELWSAYEASLNTTLEYNGKVFGHSEIDQKALDVADRLVMKGKFPEEGMPWDTYLGQEKVIMYAADIDGLKDAEALQMQTNFIKYKTLEAQVNLATTAEEVSAIVW